MDGVPYLAGLSLSLAYTFCSYLILWRSSLVSVWHWAFSRFPWYTRLSLLSPRLRLEFRVRFFF